MEQAGRRWRRWPLLAAIITLAVVLTFVLIGDDAGALVQRLVDTLH